MLIDSHAHLHLPWFKLDELDVIINRASEHGVTSIINCSSHPKSFDQVLQSTRHAEIAATLGIQPTYVKEYPDANPLRQIEDLHKKIVAIGEVGLDYYWVKEEKERELQQVLFRDCIELATELDLPLVIHSRKAETPSLDMLEKYATTPVLLHSFDGNLKEIERANDLGYKITIPTIVTRRKNRRKVAVRAGLDNILLETDSPFCTVDESIERNEPMYISTAASYLASLFETDLDTVAKVTTSNSKAFHSI